MCFFSSARSPKSVRKKKKKKKKEKKNQKKTQTTWLTAGTGESTDRVPNGRLNVCNIQIGPQSLRPLKTGYIYIEHRPLCPFCCVCVSNQHTNISQLNKEETQNNKQQKAHLSNIYVCV